SVLHPEHMLPATVKALVRSLVRRELPVYEEIAAQLRKLRCAGIHPSHIDSHKHTHLLPPVLDAMARAAREFGIPWVRRPFDFSIDARAGMMKAALAVGMRALRPAFTSALKGLRTTDHFAGFQITGALDAGTLAEMLRRLPPGLTELMCHPGRLGPELRNAATRLRESREIELAALISPEIRLLIAERGIQLVRYN
ncbi:MAG TPA: ChbG/HpnK family deacetylase, partial [Bryobacteraceae bacterium]|nr:ChbG/HpnK family deacetylase [Bryobacteraceae bacterium]